MSTQERELFQENEACAGCEWLEDCRREKQPRRTSCAIRMFRKYWAKELGDGQREDHGSGV